MLHGTRHETRPHVLAVVRDAVEIVAIVAAGAWAFYVFAYENRIKPSFASPEVNFQASLQRLGEKNGLIAVRLHQGIRNIGTVEAYFVGVVVNVYGERVNRSAGRIAPPPAAPTYRYAAFYRTTPEDAVYSLGYITRMGDPSSSQITELQPGDTIENDYTFYVPTGRYDVLTVEINGVFTKYGDALIPAHLERSPQGAARVAFVQSPKTILYDTNPVTSLSL